MAHEIDHTGGRANMAFLGSRNDIWHRLGQEMAAGMSVGDWAKAAGLEWSAIMVPAIADLSGAQFAHLTEDQRVRVVDGWRHIVRSDNGHPLGYVSDGYHPVQPADLLGWFQRYIGVDDRFALDVAGSLRSGEIIWATATFNGELSIGGDKHVARLLMSTTFDGSGATINRGVCTRVVCMNTLRMALGEKAPEVKTRHNTKFDAARVSRELSTITAGFEAFKKVGDALAQNEMARDDIAAFFRDVLDIPRDAKEEDVSTRKLNQSEALRAAYRATAAECEAGTAWCALNSVTRYVDHDRSTRGGASEDEARMLSNQFGSGAALKAKAMDLLMPRIQDKVAA